VAALLALGIVFAGCSSDTGSSGGSSWEDNENEPSGEPYVPPIPGEGPAVDPDGVKLIVDGWVPGVDLTTLGCIFVTNVPQMERNDRNKYVEYGITKTQGVLPTAWDGLDPTAGAVNTCDAKGLATAFESPLWDNDGGDYYFWARAAAWPGHYSAGKAELIGLFRIAPVTALATGTAVAAWTTAGTTFDVSELTKKNTDAITIDSAMLPYSALGSPEMSIEYCLTLVANAAPVAGDVWQADTVFTGLTKGTEYKLFARVSAGFLKQPSAAVIRLDAATPACVIRTTADAATPTAALAAGTGTTGAGVQTFTHADSAYSTYAIQINSNSAVPAETAFATAAAMVGKAIAATGTYDVYVWAQERIETGKPDVIHYLKDTQPRKITGTIVVST
jgi:hypothetical protein